MKQIVLNVTQNEYELLTRIGTVEKITDGDSFNVKFGFPTGYTMDELIENLDKCIEFQESDGGDWLRAQEYRKAKPELLSKIRRSYLTLVREL